MVINRDDFIQSIFPRDAKSSRDADAAGRRHATPRQVGQGFAGVAYTSIVPALRARSALRREDLQVSRRSANSLAKPNDLSRVGLVASTVGDTLTLKQTGGSGTVALQLASGVEEGSTPRRRLCRRLQWI
jgi:hypothetical protein